MSFRPTLPIADRAGAPPGPAWMIEFNMRDTLGHADDGQLGVFVQRNDPYPTTYTNLAGHSTDAGYPSGFAFGSDEPGFTDPKIAGNHRSSANARMDISLVPGSVYRLRVGCAHNGLGTGFGYQGTCDVHNVIGLSLNIVHTFAMNGVQENVVNVLGVERTVPQWSAEYDTTYWDSGVLPDNGANSGLKLVLDVGTWIALSHVSVERLP